MGSEIAFATSTGVGFVFLLLGGPALTAWGLTTEDLRIAGGLTLLVFAIYDMLFSRAERKQRVQDDDEALRDSLHGDEDETDVGIVPLGVPILLGPAAMTALLVFAETHGRLEVSIAFLGNALINGALLFNADLVRRLVGRPFIRATGKVMGVVLATLAVSMIRVGLTKLIEGG